MSTNTVGHRITPSLQTGLTALGSTQSTAFPLTNNTWHEFTTVASGTGVILPAGKTPSEVRVFNDSANPLRVYPPVGGTINAGTVNLPVSLAAGNGLTYWASSLSNWYSIQTVSSGSATLPGGTSGQIQYDNAGAFGGFTAGGDATINTSTGAVTVTSTNGTAFAASATTNTVNASNITSGTLPVAQLPTSGVLPTSLTGTGVIPAGAFPALTGAVVTTAGSLATTFGAIAANKFFGNQSGSSAPPAALTNIAANTDGSVNFTGISHSSPVAGDLWFPSSDQGTFAIGRASGPAKLGGCVFSCLQCASVNNTTTATSLLGSPTNPKGSLTFPANTLAAGNLLRWIFTGSWGVSASGVTFTFEVLLNGSPILVPLTGSVQTSTAAQTSQALFCQVPNYYQILSVGSSGTGAGQANFTMANNGGGTLNQILFPTGSLAPTSTFASNSAALFDIKVTIGTASASNFVQLNSFQLFLDN
jgi:hypothetical protein